MQLGRPEWPCSIEAFKVSIRAWQSVNPVPLPVLYSYNTSKRAYRATVHRRLRGGGGASLFRDGVSRSEAWDGRDADLFRPLIRACTGSLCRLPPVVLNRTGTLPVRSIVLVRVTGVSRVSFNRCVPCVPCVRSHTQTHIHIHTSTSHTKAGPARGRFKMATCPW